MDSGEEATEGENGRAPAWGNTQADRLIAGIENWFSLPARTGVAGAGADSDEEDWATQQPVWPQSQQVQTEFRAAGA